MARLNPVTDQGIVTTIVNSSKGYDDLSKAKHLSYVGASIYLGSVSLTASSYATALTISSTASNTYITGQPQFSYFLPNNSALGTSAIGLFAPSYNGIHIPSGGLYQLNLNYKNYAPVGTNTVLQLIPTINKINYSTGSVTGQSQLATIRGRDTGSGGVFGQDISSTLLLAIPPSDGIPLGTLILRVYSSANQTPNESVVGAMSIMKVSDYIPYC